MRIVTAALALLVPVAIFLACASSNVSSSSTKVSVGKGLTIEHVTSGNEPSRTMDITSPDGTATGKTACIQFKDGVGNALGAPVSVTIPATGVPVPSGATDMGSGDCPDEENGVLALPQALPASLHRRWSFYGLPIGAAADHYTSPVLTYSLRVRAEDLAQAEMLRDQVVAHGPTMHLPWTVDIVHFSYFWVDEARQAVVFQVADEDPFETLNVEINGSPQLTLQDAARSYSKGWHVATFAIPLGDGALHWGSAQGEYRNTFRITQQVSHEQAIETLGDWTLTVH